MAGEALSDFSMSRLDIKDLGKLGDTAGPIDVGGATVTTIQATNTTGAWGSGVLTVERSNDNETYYALTAGATTISADGITTMAPDTKWIRVRVSTAGTAGHSVRLGIYSRLS